MSRLIGCASLLGLTDWAGIILDGNLSQDLLCSFIKLTATAIISFAFLISLSSARFASPAAPAPPLCFFVSKSRFITVVILLELLFFMSSKFKF